MSALKAIEVSKSKDCVDLFCWAEKFIFTRAVCDSKYLDNLMTLSCDFRYLLQRTENTFFSRKLKNE